MLAVGLLAILTGAVSAQKGFENGGLQIYADFSREFVETSSKEFLPNKLSINSHGQNVSAVNQHNFNIGSKFVFAILNSSLLENNEKVLNSTIIDLVYLIDSLDGEPESAALQKTLQSLIRKTANCGEIRTEIINASNSYSTRLRGEESWYYSSGATVTNLLINAYFGDNTAIKKNLSEILNLVKIAPQETSEKITLSMKSLAEYVKKSTFAKDDYLALLQDANILIDTVNA